MSSTTKSPVPRDTDGNEITIGCELEVFHGRNKGLRTRITGIVNDDCLQGICTAPDDRGNYKIGQPCNPCALKQWWRIVGETAPSVAAASTTCTKCNTANPFVDPQPNYVCGPCRRTYANLAEVFGGPL